MDSRVQLRIPREAVGTPELYLIPGHFAHRTSFLGGLLPRCAGTPWRSLQLVSTLKVSRGMRRRMPCAAGGRLRTNRTYSSPVDPRTDSKRKRSNSLQNGANKPRHTAPRLGRVSCSRVPAKVKIQAEAGRTRTVWIGLSRGKKALRTAIA